MQPFVFSTTTVTATTTHLLTPWSRVLLEKLTGFPANQEIPRILGNPKVHYRTHKRPPPVPITTTTNNTQAAKRTSQKDHINFPLNHSIINCLYVLRNSSNIHRRTNLTELI